MVWGSAPSAPPGPIIDSTAHLVVPEDGTGSDDSTPSRNRRYRPGSTGSRLLVPDRSIRVSPIVTTDMAATPEPRSKNLADLYDLAPLDWTDVRRSAGRGAHLAPGTGGPGHHTFWLSTVDADGRPHLTAVGAFWVDDRYYFCGGPRSRKIRNIERDPRCAFGVALDGFDVALEGTAAVSPTTQRCCDWPRCSPRVAGRPAWPRAASPISTALRVPALRRGTSTNSFHRMPMRSPPGSRGAPPGGRSDRAR